MNLLKTQKTWYSCGKTISEIDIELNKKYIKINNKEYEYRSGKKQIEILEAKKPIGCLIEQDDGTILFQLFCANHINEITLY